ncbi:acetaldehyde dehydrogenase (acetylating) [Isobaculum melis]|uniref:Acetaldehyde dehydrogenase (Acetylating) n=1 Tax=Isobaculum melis TaxID=142588 RepID=A0A1H9SNE0_9LACT|nr:acetaldehyde dehydrogenase (acetylating) [Isobaculum melis]SER86437.1 acetaldehyde dehydrogenase (acetylating) [Isobaculum melis]
MTTTVLTKTTEVETLIATAKQAQQLYATYSQEQVDAIIKNVHEMTYQHREELAISAHEETGFGNVADKIIKNEFASNRVYDSIKDIPTVGVINRLPEQKLIEVGIPMGIVAGLIPSTNPTSTVIFKALIALKTRNAIIFSPHPKALASIQLATKIVEEAAVAAGAPSGLVSVINQPTLEATSDLMQHEDIALILATGGKAMVHAAYSSGTPAIGVGPGNSPVLIEKTADIKTSIDRIIQSKTFDYGTICASEQALVVDASIKEEVIQALKAKHAYFLNEAESEKISQFILRDNGALNPDIVGKSAPLVAALAGIDVPENTTVLISEQTEVSHTNPYSREKLTPILALYTVNAWEEGLTLCNELLLNEGAGHTASLHTSNEVLAEEFGLRIHASRILVNTLGALGAIGGTTNLMPSLTLGCGAIGGSSTTDNVSVHQLLNIKRVAFHQ